MLDAAHMLCGEGQQGHVARAFERDGQAALVLGAGAGFAARLNLGAVRQVAAQALGILIVDVAHVVHTELADLAARAIFTTGTGRRALGAAITIAIG